MCRIRTIYKNLATSWSKKMSTTKVPSVYLFIASSLVFGVTKAATCYRELIFYTYYEYCAFGCCSYGTLDHCCSGTWPILGIIVGVGVVIAILVTVVCCCRRNRGNTGMVCRPNTGTTTTVVTAGQNQYQGMHPQQYPMSYPASGYTAGYQAPQTGYQPAPTGYPRSGYQPAPTGYPQPGFQQQAPSYPPYQPTTQAGYVGASETTYTGYPESKASAPPMDAPPPYPD